MHQNINDYTAKLPAFKIDQRLFGRYFGNRPGPNVIFFAGIHGNEPAGILALLEVEKKLKELKPDFRGNFFSIAGNMSAMDQGKRYLGKDLNRIWFPNSLIPKQDRMVVPEYKEKIGILNELVRIVDNGQPTYIVDLHTTSSHSVPFISISDTLKNRRIIRNIPANLVLGLEELLDGPMFSFFSELGLPAILFEAGQHTAISSLENHIAFIWLILVELKSINKRKVPGYSMHYNTLKKNTSGIARAYEIKYRYVINPEEAFRMREGFVNFQKIEKGETIAYNKNGRITAKRSGHIFMPLYQPLGTDGFFITKEIRKFWFKASSRTRKWKLDKVLSILPGVKAAKMVTEGYMIDKNTARYKVISLMHLLGYRKVIERGSTIKMSRRPFDNRFPAINQVKANLEAYLKLLTE